MSDLPTTYYPLPQDFAVALGRAVAAFGWLEEIIKRTIYSLDRARLAADLTEPELKRWLHQIEELADDSMGPVIEQLNAALRRHPGITDRAEINDQLQQIKQQRNILCHASWRPGSAEGHWHPAFVNANGDPGPGDMNAADIEAIHAQTLDLGQRLIAIMRQTGIVGVWTGDDGPQRP